MIPTKSSAFTIERLLALPEERCQPSPATILRGYPSPTYSNKSSSPFTTQSSSPPTSSHSSPNISPFKAMYPSPKDSSPLSDKSFGKNECDQDTPFPNSDNTNASVTSGKDFANENISNFSNALKCYTAIKSEYIPSLDDNSTDTPTELPRHQTFFKPPMFDNVIKSNFMQAKQDDILQYLRSNSALMAREWQPRWQLPPWLSMSLG